MSILLSSKFPGETRRGGGYDYFLPADIFLAKRLVFDGNLLQGLEIASHSFGKFTAKINDIPHIEMFMRSYANKEAVHSTRIEGTQASIPDAFVDDESRIAFAKRSDWHELRQYILALNAGVAMLDQLPLGERLIRDIHKIVLSQARGHGRSPGEYRRMQNWIGGSHPASARFVPPPPQCVDEAMRNLELFIQDRKVPMPELIKIALIHWQFETIHPFLDGNGRVGRILILLYLMERKMLSRPALFLSAFFEKHRPDYYDALHAGRVDEKGIKRWIAFFLEGIAVTSRQAMQKTESLIKLKERITGAGVNVSGSGKQVKSAIKLAEFLFKKPVVHSALVSNELQLTPQTTNTLLNGFLKNGILKEITGQKRNRVFVFEEYLNLLNRDEDLTDTNGRANEQTGRQANRQIDGMTNRISQTEDASQTKYQAK